MLPEISNNNCDLPNFENKPTRPRPDGSMCVRVMTVSILAIFLIACVGRRAIPSTGSPIDAVGECEPSLTVLPISPLRIEQQREDRVHRLELRADGRVLDGAKVVATVWGGCVLDANGKPLLGVHANGAVEDSSPHIVAKFSKRAPVRRPEGVWVSFEEVLELEDGVSLAISDGGAVWNAPIAGEAVSLPAHVDGAWSQARRTALLLLLLERTL